MSGALTTAVLEAFRQLGTSPLSVVSRIDGRNSPVAGRPVVALSFALNYRLGGFDGDSGVTEGGGSCLGGPPENRDASSLVTLRVGCVANALAYLDINPIGFPDITVADYDGSAFDSSKIDRIQWRKDMRKLINLLKKHKL